MYTFFSDKMYPVILDDYECSCVIQIYYFFVFYFSVNTGIYLSVSMSSTFNLYPVCKLCKIAPLLLV